jgi:hypothetical protein
MAHPKNITGRSKTPPYKNLVRIAFRTPYPERSGTIHSRKPLLTLGEEITIGGNPETYVVVSSSVAATPSWGGTCNKYEFTASAPTVKAWTARLNLEAQKHELMAAFAPGR